MQTEISETMHMLVPCLVAALLCVCDQLGASYALISSKTMLFFTLDAFISKSEPGI